MHARFVLQWLAGELDATPLWNGDRGSVHVTDGTPFPRSPAEIADVHSWAELALWRTSRHDDPAHGYARGIVQLLDWTCGAAAAGPLTGKPATAPPSPCEVSLEVGPAMAGLEHARQAQAPVLAARLEGVMETFSWLTGWSPEPPADRHGHLPADTCQDRAIPCDCDSAGACLTDRCPACRRWPCVHGFGQVIGI